MAGNKREDVKFRMLFDQDPVKYDIDTLDVDDLVPWDVDVMEEMGRIKERENALKKFWDNGNVTDEQYAEGLQRLRGKRDEVVEDISKGIEKVYKESPNIKSKEMSIEDKIRLRQAVGQSVGDFPIAGDFHLDTSPAGTRVGKRVLNEFMHKLLKTVPALGAVYTAGEVMTGDAHASEVLPEAIIPTRANMGGADEMKRQMIEDPSVRDTVNPKIIDSILREEGQPKSIQELRELRRRMLGDENAKK